MMLVNRSNFFSAIENWIFIHYIILIKLRKQRVRLTPSINHDLAEVALVFLFYGYKWEFPSVYEAFRRLSYLFYRTWSMRDVRWVLRITWILFFQIFLGWHIWWTYILFILNFVSNQLYLISWFENVWNYVIVSLWWWNLRIIYWPLTTFSLYNFLLNLNIFVLNAFIYSFIRRNDNRW